MTDEIRVSIRGHFSASYKLTTADNTFINIDDIQFEFHSVRRFVGVGDGTAARLLIDANCIIQIVLKTLNEQHNLQSVTYSKTTNITAQIIKYELMLIN